MEVYRNFGSCMTPQSAWLQTLGLETLTLRVAASCDNSLAIAQYLETRSDVRQINYPGLEVSPWYANATRQFGGRYGGVLSFELGSKEDVFRFINKLKLIRRATNINDNRSLIIHPASTIFADCGKEELNSMGISDGLIRLSVGIETIEDLLHDISQAFEF
jgi:O-acetylhomoserine (thiol)-lyase